MLAFMSVAILIRTRGQGALPQQGIRAQVDEVGRLEPLTAENAKADWDSSAERPMPAAVVSFGSHKADRGYAPWNTTRGCSERPLIEVFLVPSRYAPGRLVGFGDPVVVRQGGPASGEGAPRCRDKALLCGYPRAWCLRKRSCADALVGGSTDPEVLAELARGRLRSKLSALRNALERGLVTRWCSSLSFSAHKGLRSA
jgi:hypothetical protein